ncbi:uncharacterized protein LAJ45_03306 [Morchella importuna]|uniref:uncharacterized protein n=1 Tax=Morchella importuna TaxID=1174673 RepID=UPI001E8EB5DD|nr:uncharacterized protein LAJ45_03306 [Morchella importuna]KAH8152466.1 hypothetical protein LAJ45_03306 [Morchella importuna]
MYLEPLSEWYKNYGNVYEERINLMFITSRFSFGRKHNIGGSNISCLKEEHNLNHTLLATMCSLPTIV